MDWQIAGWTKRGVELSSMQLKIYCVEYFYFEFTYYILSILVTNIMKCLFFIFLIDRLIWPIGVEEKDKVLIKIEKFKKNRSF